MIQQIAHLCLFSKDLARTEHFYCQVLGLRKQFEFRKDGALYGFYLEVGNRTFLEFFQGDSAPGGTIRHLCLEAEDLDSIAQRLRAAGFKATEKTLGCDQSWQFWTEDPDGVSIEFHQYTEKSAQMLGGTVEVNW